MRVSVRRAAAGGARAFTTSGRLVLPEGVALSAGCRGTVTVSITARRRTISTRRARVRSDCSFLSRVAFASTRRFAGARRLVVSARFGGNAALRRATARPRVVSASPFARPRSSAG